MATCEKTDFSFPLLADVYYPSVDQGAYGNLKKNWVLDRTIACNFGSAGRKFKEDMNTEPMLTLSNSLIGITRGDLTQSNTDSLYSMTNIIITNIRTSDGTVIYNESSGARVGKPTLFELATSNPFVGAFGKLEHYKLVIRRSENQAIDL